MLSHSLTVTVQILRYKIWSDPDLVMVEDSEKEQLMETLVLRCRQANTTTWSEVRDKIKAILSVQKQKKDVA